MRDLVFLAVFLILFLLAMKRPFVAVSLWIWSGLVVPKHWLWGMAESISYNTAFAVITILGFIVNRNKPAFRVEVLFVIVIVFFLHTTLTSALTINIQSITWTSWNNFFKGTLLFVFTCLLIRERHQFNFYLWAITLSIGFFGYVEGAKFLLSFGGHHISGPTSHILADNNHFAAAISMTLPLIVYLISQTEEKILRLGLYSMLLICTIAILGTHSRGGLIGLTVVGGYFWVKSNKKLISLGLFAIVSIIAVSFLPDSWFDRMESIEQLDQDSSFMTRVVSWKQHTVLAINRPFTGGGFKALEDTYVWNETAKDIDILDFIDTPEPTGDRGWAAHSIYFQVLGDHGFVGFFIFIWMLFISYMKLGSIERYFAREGNQNAWQSNLAKMLKVSLVAYCVTGAALSLAYVELLYVLIAIIVSLSINVTLQKKKADFQNVKKMQKRTI